MGLYKARAGWRWGNSSKQLSGWNPETICPLHWGLPFVTHFLCTNVVGFLQRFWHGQKNSVFFKWPVLNKNMIILFAWGSYLCIQWLGHLQNWLLQVWQEMSRWFWGTYLKTSFCALSISCFRLAFGIREVASANSALVDVWDMDNRYRVVGCWGFFAHFIPRVRETTISV